MIAVKTALKASQCNFSKSTCEHIFITLNLHHTKLIFAAIYISQNVQQDTRVYLEHATVVEELMSSYPEHKLCILGDYNLPHLNWSYENVLTYKSNHRVKNTIIKFAQILQETYSLYGMKQYYPVNPTSGYSLDLLFSSLDFNYVLPPEPLVTVDPNHPPAYFTLNINNKVEKTQTHYCYNFKAADFENINNIIGLELPLIYEENDVNQNCNKFYSTLKSIIDRYVPKIPMYSSNFPRWYTHELKHQIVLKKVAHKKWKTTRDTNFYIEFKRLRAICLRSSKKYRADYLKSVETHITRDPRFFWNYFNSLQTPDKIPTNLTYNDKTSENTKESSNLFMEFFQSHYKHDKDPPKTANYHSNQNQLSITAENVLSAIKDSNCSYENRIDGIPSVLLKNCLNIVPHLVNLYNLSLQTGIFPDTWKSSIITPIYKQGPKHLVTNYRPIAQLPATAKIFDKIITTKLSDIVLPHIVKNQHGFMPGRSIVTNLLNFNNFVSCSLNKHSQVDVAYMDFSKAFDSVDHAILIDKIKTLKLNEKLIDWIISYLHDRKYRVLLNNQLSEQYVATSGVPQGSHLGPLLFIIFINDILSEIKHSQLLIFADDVKIFKEINTLTDCSLFQEDLLALYDWSNKNLLPFNIKKCNVMSIYTGHTYTHKDYKINDILLPRVTHTRDLGIIYNDRFNFDNHLNNTIAKSSKRLGILRYTSRNFKNPHTYIQLYKSLILPLLVFGSVIWSPTYQNSIHELEKVQHRFLRSLAYKAGTPMDKASHDYSEIASKYNIPSVESIHRYNDMICVYKCIHLNYLQDDSEIFKLKISHYPQRRSFVLEETRSRTNDILHTTTFRLRKDWNNLPEGMRSIGDLATFSKDVKKLVYKFK